MERTFTNLDVPKRSFQHFAKMKNKKALCDVTFQVGDESISAHSIIITAVIPYFRDMLIDNDSKTDEGGIRTPDIEPDAFKCLIEYAYNFQVKIDTSNVRNLLAAASFLGVDEVKEACCDFLADSLQPDDVLNIRELASNFNCSQLLVSIDSYVKENFELISQTKDFLSYPLTYVKELISKDDLKIDDEKKVFDAVLKWVKSSPENRKDELPELILKIRMPLIEPMYLYEIAITEELIRTSVLCRDLLDEARIYNSYPKLRKSVCSFAIEPRQCMKTDPCVGEEMDGNRCIYKLYAELRYAVQHFNSTEKKWHTKEYYSYYVTTGSIAQVQNKLYFFDYIRTVGYDPENNEYKILAQVPTPTAFGGAACLYNKIYVCGGRIGNTAFNAVKCFDPKKNEWTSVKSMPTCRWAASVVAFSGYIYVLGGRDSSCVFNIVERYDPVTDKWKTMLPLLSKRSGAGATVLNGKIYVCGGSTLPDMFEDITLTAEMYDPVKNRWEFISSMNAARTQLTLLTYCGKLYAVGGISGNNKKHVKIFDVYDPETDSWACFQGEGNELCTSGAVVLPALKM